MTREELQLRIGRIRQELAEASDGKYPAPKLIAVTKTHTPEEILPLAEAGITEIGENRVQELTAKLPGLENRFQVHLIGRLQRNKVKQIIGNVCMIQSVDSEPGPGCRPADAGSGGSKPCRGGTEGRSPL